MSQVYARIANMLENPLPRLFSMLALIGVCGSAGGCSTFPFATGFASTTDEHECLTRAMYFESNRSSEDGLLAVGTVVMNRVASPAYPKTICGVVGQPGQFASGVLWKSMRPDEERRVERIADEILAGKRETALGDAMFFHQAGPSFPFTNMHYVLVAGGNAFYRKETSTPSRAPAGLSDGAGPAGHHDR
jgi:spore germination cell wall hydrolase CwlJ-like protein